MLIQHISLLWSDMIIWVAVAAAICIFTLKCKSLRWQAGLQKLLMSYRGILAISVLSIYIGIGLVDSIHLKEDDQIVSLFDKIISPIGQRIEKTYSEPLSIYLFDGMKTRLAEVAQNINSDDDKWLDIDRKMTGALLHAVLYWIIMMSIILFIQYLSHMKTSHHERLLRHIPKVEKQKRLIFFASISFLLIFIMTCCVELSKSYYLLGTNKIGQDIFYLVIKSIRTGLLIGVLTTLIGLPFAIILGLLAGYFAGWVDQFIQFIYTTISSIPGVLLISALVLLGGIFIQDNPNLFPNTLYRADARLILLCCVMGLTSWTSLCRLLRAEVFKLKVMGFVESAKTMGIPTWRILGHHILLNVMHLVLIVSVLDFSGLVLAEAILSYVGVGVDPSTPSFGNLLNQASGELARQPVVWWSLLGCFTCLFGLVLFANILADLIRESFDPRLQQ